MLSQLPFLLSYNIFRMPRQLLLLQKLQHLRDTESAMYKMLFGNNNDSIYGIAFRVVYSVLDAAGFSVFYVYEGDVYGNYGLCAGYSGSLREFGTSIGVRPIVYLNSNIQTSSDTVQDHGGAWGIYFRMDRVNEKEFKIIPWNHTYSADGIIGVIGYK